MGDMENLLAQMAGANAGEQPKKKEHKPSDYWNSVLWDSARDYIRNNLINNENLKEGEGRQARKKSGKRLEIDKWLDADDRFKHLAGDRNGETTPAMKFNGGYWIMKFFLQVMKEYKKGQLERNLDKMEKSFKKARKEFASSDIRKDFAKAVQKNVDNPQQALKDVQKTFPNQSRIRRLVETGMFDYSDPKTILAFASVPVAKSSFALTGQSAEFAKAEAAAIKSYRDQVQFPMMMNALEKGMDPNTNYGGMTLISKVMSQPRFTDGGLPDQGIKSMMMALVEKGADVNHKVGDDSPLTLAKTPEELRILFAAGAVGNEKFYGGDNTALRLATRFELDMPANAEDQAKHLMNLKRCLIEMQANGIDIYKTNDVGDSAFKRFDKLKGSTISGITEEDIDTVPKTEPVYADGSGARIKIKPSNSDFKKLPEELMKTHLKMGEGQAIAEMALHSDLLPGSKGGDLLQQANDFSRSAVVDKISIENVLSDLKDISFGDNEFTKIRLDNLKFNKNEYSKLPEADQKLLRGIADLTENIRNDPDNAQDLVKTYFDKCNAVDKEAKNMPGSTVKRSSMLLTNAFNESSGNNHADRLREAYLNVDENPFMVYWHPDNRIDGDPDGNNILMKALKNGDRDLVLAILSAPPEWQPDLNFKNFKRESVLTATMEYFAKTGDPTIVEMISPEMSQEGKEPIYPKFETPLNLKMAARVANRRAVTPEGFSLSEHYVFTAYKMNQDPEKISANVKWMKSIGIDLPESKYPGMRPVLNDPAPVSHIPSVEPPSPEQWATFNAVFTGEHVPDKTVESGALSKVDQFLAKKADTFYSSRNPEEKRNVFSDTMQILSAERVSTEAVAMALVNTMDLGTDVQPNKPNVKMAVMLQEVLKERVSQISNDEDGYKVHARIAQPLAAAAGIVKDFGMVRPKISAEENVVLGGVANGAAQVVEKLESHSNRHAEMLIQKEIKERRERYGDSAGSAAPSGGIGNQ